MTNPSIPLSLPHLLSQSSVPLCYLLQHPRSTTIPNPKWSDTAAKPPLQKNPTSKAKSASASAASASASASATLHPAPLVRTTRPRSKVEPQVVKPKWKHCNKEEMALAREANVLAKAAATVEKEAKLVECMKGLQAVAEMENKMACPGCRHLYPPEHIA